MHQPFQGLKVIELAAVLAGPSVGMFFAELGAEVIKVENKRTGGDVTRNWKLPSEDEGKAYSAYFSSINYGKQHLFLDLKAPADYHRLCALVEDADVLISNYREKQALSLKVGYERLSALNPRLVYAELTGFGKQSDRPAFDVVLQAEAGFMFMNGEPGRPPVKMPVALIDLLAAHQMKEGILIALLQREATGEGCRIETSLYQSALASLANQASNWLMAGHIPQPMGSQHPNIAPYGDVFHTSDGKPLVLAVGTERQFTQLCEALGLNLHELPGFSTNTQRVLHRAELNGYLARAISKTDMAALSERFLKLGIPFGQIRNMKEVFEQADARKMVLEERMADGDTSKRVSSIAFKIMS